MKKLLLTGSTGFVGKNLLPKLIKHYEVLTPTRLELDLKNQQAVYEYLEREKCDVVLHTANPNPIKNTLDTKENMLEASLKIFMNFYETRNLYGKMLYLGSGAEYDKRRDMNGVVEEEIGKYIPEDPYGFGKYIMNALARDRNNIYNLRLFACFGPYDHASKFITHAIRCCMDKGPITIRQDCYFDYIHVEDLGNIVLWFIENTPEFKDYNICSGKGILLSEIAKEVSKQMEPIEIICLKEGYNKSYVGNCNRLLRELKDFKFTPIEEGIGKQIIWEGGNR